MLLGIDLGTTFSATAVLGPSGIPVLTPDRRDGKNFHTPSVVHVGSKGVLVGEPVERLLEDTPEMEVARFAKSSMGTDDRFFTQGSAPGLPAHGVSALILAKLRRDFVERYMEEPSKVVVTVPAHFNERQRQATCNAAQLADLPLVGLIEEPVAAAAFVASQRESKGERTILVFDLGGGTLDTTLLHATAESLYVLGSEGEANVGGRNFDEIIMGMVRSQFRATYGTEPAPTRDNEQRLRQFATAAKLDLSREGQSVVRKTIKLSDGILETVLMRGQFEAELRLWMEACVESCERLLSSRKLSWSDVDDLVLTGGSSQLPCIGRALRECSGIAPERILTRHPRSAIAYGAALLGEQLYGDKDTMAPLLRQTVSTNELGLLTHDPQTGRKTIEVLVSKNRPLPVQAQKTLYVDTIHDDHVSIEIMQRKDVYSDPETLGVFAFGPLPSALTDHPIEVDLGYDRQGRAHVKVTDRVSGINLQQAIDTQGNHDLYELKERLGQMPLLG